jgi:hypothetical protein
MKRSIYLGGLAALVLASACSKIPGLGKLGGGGGNGRRRYRAGAGADRDPHASTTTRPSSCASWRRGPGPSRPTPRPRATTRCASRSPRSRSAIAAARAKFPDRDYQPLREAPRSTPRPRSWRSSATARPAPTTPTRSMQAIRVEELQAQIREHRHPDLTLSRPRGALAYLERDPDRGGVSAASARGLPEASAPPSPSCARPPPAPICFAGPAADEALADVDGDLDTSWSRPRCRRRPRARSGSTTARPRFLDVEAWVGPRLGALDALAADTGVPVDTASRRARATQLATAFADALVAAAKKDAMPKGLITSPTITETAVNWIDDDGKVIRAGVEKASVRSVKNDFGVVTGKSGNGLGRLPAAGQAVLLPARLRGLRRGRRQPLAAQLDGRGAHAVGDPLQVTARRSLTGCRRGRGPSGAGPRRPPRRRRS